MGCDLTDGSVETENFINSEGNSEFGEAMVKYDVDGVVKWLKSLNDVKVLKRVVRVAYERIDELREGVEWSDEAIQELWGLLSEDAKRLIKYLAEKGGSAFKSEVLKNFGWKEMKPTGVIAGINTRARNMGYKAVVKRTNVKIGGGWDVKYELNEKWLNFIKSLQGA